MTYQVLARKWRPKIFADVIGQSHVTKTLQNSILTKKIAHAYLLTGTRGVGKTTIARIFAKAIRCENLKPDGEPCLKCNSCESIENSSAIDFTEIDGASNTGVDNIRELIDNVQYLPTTGTTKVYVIDEVHMLSVNAFNALLKTLEEPPKHVVFIFATTDPQKLLGTVLSRCQRFDFKNVTIEDLVNHIKFIAKQENIVFKNELIINELAKQGRGSVRDTLSLLDQVLSLSLDGQITEDILYMSLGLANTKSIQQIVKGVLEGDKFIVNKYFKAVVSENVDLHKFTHQLLDRLFDIIQNLDTPNKIAHEENLDLSVLDDLSMAELMWIYESLSKDLQWALSSLDTAQSVLFSLSKVCLRKQIFSNQAVVSTLSTSQQQQEQIVIQQLEPQQPIKLEDEKNWNGFLDFLKEKQKSIAANVERGNLIKQLDINSNILNIEINFTEDNKIFFDYLREPNTKNKLKNELNRYFEFPLDKIEVEFNLLDTETAQKNNFRNQVEVQELKETLKLEERKKKLLNNKHIKEAEQLFNTQIDKIILNED
jgi:DNA polymerase III subunit gamma/tau